MEKEVSYVVEIAVTLIAVSALIGIIWFTVYLGNSMANEVTNETSDIVAVSESGVLKELCDTNTIMPTSAVYSLLRTYSNYIPEYTCNLHDAPVELDMTVEQVPCILQHMTGKVSLQVEENESGWFCVTIHHMNCNWFNGTCNCSTLR